jgi:hypothetical protein
MAQVVYKLDQVTWGGGKFDDFNLPITLGHYSSEEKADKAMWAHIDRIAARKSEDSADRAEPSDYRVTPIQVE